MKKTDEEIVKALIKCDSIASGNESSTDFSILRRDELNDEVDFVVFGFDGGESFALAYDDGNVVFAGDWQAPIPADPKYEDIKDQMAWYDERGCQCIMLGGYPRVFM